MALKRIQWVFLGNFGAAPGALRKSGGSGQFGVSKAYCANRHLSLDQSSGTQWEHKNSLSSVFETALFGPFPTNSCSLNGQNRQSPITSVQRARSTLASHSAVPCGTNVKRMNANRAIRSAAQRTQGLWGLIFVFLREIWAPTTASDSNRSDNSR